jgi:hypothetical protein
MNPITKRNFAALFVAMVVLAGVANAEGHAHKAKKGRLKITMPTQAGDALLQPGDYTVREVNSKDGAVVEFVRVTFDTTVQEGVWPYEEEVVARVKSSEQALSAPPKHTQLLLAPEAANAIALEIRGDAVKYLLEQPPDAGKAGAMADRADSAAQNGR